MCCAGAALGLAAVALEVYSAVDTLFGPDPEKDFICIAVSHLLLMIRLPECCISFLAGSVDRADIPVPHSSPLHRSSSTRTQTD